MRHFIFIVFTLVLVLGNANANTIKLSESFHLDFNEISLTKDEIECLQRNVFFEAGVEDVIGKIAVVQITMNRLQSGKWGDDVCSVVHAKKQFSWTHTKKKHTKPKGKLWNDSKRAVKLYLYGVRITELNQSMFYHADYVKPVWSNKFTRVMQIGSHIFYEG